MESLRHRLARIVQAYMDTVPRLDSQIKMSKEARVAQSTVQRILAGTQGATIDVLEKLATAFGVKNPQYMLLERDEVELLTLWSRMGIEEKNTVLGFMRIKHQANEPAQDQTFLSGALLPPDIGRASKLDSGQSLNQTTPKSNDKQRQKKPRTEKR